MTKTSEDTQFTLSLKDYLDDKFKVVSQRIDSLVTSIDNLIKETNHTKERLEKVEQDIIDIRRDHESFRGVFRAHMKVIVMAFLVGSFVWIQEAREFILSVIRKYLGF